MGQNEKFLAERTTFLELVDEAAGGLLLRGPDDGYIPEGVLLECIETDLLSVDSIVAKFRESVENYLAEMRENAKQQ